MPQASARPSGPLLRRALARADRGATLSLDETTTLLGARGDGLDRLLAVAARLRDLGHGDVVTYSPKVFVPLTMLCRDHCHYCTFAKPPAKLEAPFLTPEEAVAIARAGAEAGCKEALFTLGDRPEDRYELARTWLDERGYDSTLDYVRAVAIRVIEETGLLPHLNPGVMSYEEIARLKHVAASMGIMLETSSERLAAKGGPHFGSPDKVPAVRLRTIEDAGRLAVPFTTGILVGIGETERERAEALVDIRDLHRRYRHVQEVIVQNFRAKPGTAMAGAPEPGDEEFLAAVATARVVLGPRMHLQAPPNLSDPAQRLRLLDAGIDDHARSREPGEAVAFDRCAAGHHSRPWQGAARATHDLSRVRVEARSVPRRQDARPRHRAARGRRPRRAGATPCSGAVAGPRHPLEAAHDRSHVRQR
jgi:FO synthase